MELKNIPDPGFSDDDGSASPALTSALDAWSRDRSAVGPVLTALRDARLLVPVVAVLGEVEEDENGLRREKTSDMAVPTLRAGDPNHPGLPAWRPYRLDERATMVFDRTPRVVNDPRGDERRLFAKVPFLQHGT